MLLRLQLQRLSAHAATLLRQFLRAEKGSAASVTSLTIPRKLTPIDDVVARVGREPFAPD